jgi:autotransporter translocation and assembly factor TamB
MRRVWKIVRWSALLLVVGLVLLIFLLGSSLLFLQTQQFRTLARDQVVGTLNETLTGTVSLERIEGTLWGSLILDNVSLEHNGKSLVDIPQAIARYNLRSLLDGRVEISQIALIKPVIHLEQDAQGNLDILEAVSPLTEEETPEDEESGPSSLVIALESIQIQDGQVSFRMPDQVYQLEDINLDAQLDIVPAGLEATVRHFALRALAEGFPPLSLEAAASYQNTTAPPSAQVEHIRLKTDTSQLQLTGSLSNLDMPQTKLHTNLELTIEKLALADILQLAPEVPLKHDIAGQIQVTGPLSDLHTTATLKTADATIQAEAQANLNQADQAYQTYQATVSVTQLDIPQLIRDVGDVQAVVDGTLQARGVGASFPSLEATADLAISGLQVADMRLGTASVQGSVADETAKLSGELTGSVGHATWQGTLALPEPPRYDLSFAADHLSLQKVAARQESLAGELNVSGTVQGTGFDLPSMQTQADLTIQPSTVGPVHVKHGRFVAQIANGRIHLSEGTLVTPDASVNIEGELGTTLEEIGQLSYSLEVDQLAPWLALAGQDGSGQVTLNGTATGSLANLQTQGTLRAKALTLPGVTLANAAMQFQAAELGQAQPQAAVSIDLTDLHAGLALQSVEVDIQLLPAQSANTQRVHIGLKAQEKEAPQRRHRLQAEVLAQADRIHAQLQELSLALPIGTWQLAQPVTIQQHPSGLGIDRFVLTNQAQPDQQIVLHGALATTGPQNLQLQITDFSLDNLKDFLPPQPEVSGVFSADIRVGGTAAAPTVSGEASLDALKIASQTYEGLKTNVNYQQKKASLDLTFQQDTNHALQASGRLPVSLSWANGFKSALLGDPYFHAHSDGLDLAFLNALSGNAVHGIAGEIHLDITADGPARQAACQRHFCSAGRTGDNQTFGSDDCSHYPCRERQP